MSKHKPTPRRQFSPGGVPRRGGAYPSPHEQAVLRRIARPGAFLLVTQRADNPATYSYCDTDEAILAENLSELDKYGFRWLSEWLESDRGSSLFGAPAQVWRARKPS